MTTTLAQSATNDKATKEISFGNGRYSNLMIEAFKDVKRIFKLTDDHAEKIAKQIGSDYGAAEQIGTIVGKLGKANKEMKVSVETSSKVKNVHLTFALTILYAIQFANKSADYGFMSGKTDWKANENLQNALDSFLPESE